MAFQFPSPAQDGQLVEVVQQQDGTKFVYRYNEDQNTWELKGQGLDLDTNNIVIYTNDVIARPDDPRPDPVGPPAAYALDPNDIDFSQLTDQRIINWTLNDVIQELFRLDAESIFFGTDAPEEPHDYKFWWDTERLDLTVFWNGQWWPVSVPPEQIETVATALAELQRDTMLNEQRVAQLRRDIVAGDFRPDLEQVLKVGAVADKGILLTDGEDALIALAPDEATLDIASDTEKKNPRLRLTHIDKQNYPDAQAQIELDNNGTRVDFEFFQSIDECHFRFDDEEKFVLNRDGDAVFTGKVQGEPGTQNNEFVTYGQLTTLEEEIEQLAPSLERGSWTFTLNHPPGPGEYTMISGFLSEEDQQSLCTQEYTQCYADNMDDPLAQQQCSRDLEACQNAVTGDQVLTTDDWTECEQLVFNAEDSKGVVHNWAGIDSDHYIDVFNEADEGFMVGDIATHGGGTFAFDLVSSRGTANGLASVKIFKTQGTVDFDQYVRKAGDTMTGTLNIDIKRQSTGLFVRSELTTANSILYVANGDDNTKFRVRGDGHVQAGSTSSTAFIATENHDVTTKKYVDDLIRRELTAPARYEYKCYLNQTGANGPGSGQAFLSGEDMKSSTIKLSTTATNAPVKIQGHSSGLTMYTYNSSINNTYRAMAISCWYYRNSQGTEDWKWKGTAEIDSIKLYSDYILITTSSNSYRKWANGNIGAAGDYRFTISGLL